MDKLNLQPLKGFRDFLPKDAKKRQFLKNKFVEVFELYGFEPLETPALESQELLLGKYGNGADKLIFKFEDEGGREIALRYDQTVPTSRVLAMYQQNLPMPWRRYQIQNAWRAEKPQKGRYREFIQCDVDIFGTTSPLSDAELLSLGNSLLKNLGFKDFKILLNDRQVLFNLMNYSGVEESMHLSIIQTIDKLDKKSPEEVKEELVQKGLRAEVVHKLFEELKKTKPTETLEKVILYSKNLGVSEEILKFQPFLARGLDYYNSTIYEFVIGNFKAGSVAGGGRYDNLIEKLCGVAIPATGYSWGFDRLIDAMNDSNLFPQDAKRQGVLVSILNSKALEKSSLVVKTLREKGISAEIFPDESTKLEKQLKYADKKGIKWLVVIGPDEAKNDTFILKDLETGEQDDLSQDKLIEKLKASH